MHRVVVTGLGIVSCLGNTLGDVTDALRRGRSGIELLPERKALGFRSSLGGKLKAFDLSGVHGRPVERPREELFFQVRTEVVHQGDKPAEELGFDPGMLFPFQV